VGDLGVDGRTILKTVLEGVIWIYMTGLWDGVGFCEYDNERSGYLD